jgi:NAD(P)-dependent dehydrogenase (short-subunit alcohol dehydrogenase family)
MKAPHKIALVTGGNKGIGFAVVRQLALAGCEVLLGARDMNKAREASERLRAEGLTVTPLQLDVTSDSDVEAALQAVTQQFGRLDVLINNAGVLLDPPRHPEDGEPDTEGASVFNAKLDVIRASLETNTFGALRLCQKFVPLMRQNNFGRIVNLSSGMGQLEDMNGGWPGYRLSKVALNALTRIFADELSGTNILVNSVCPGWVQTDMGGVEAERTPDEAATHIVWAALLPDGGPSGRFFRDREEIGW